MVGHREIERRVLERQRRAHA